MTQLPEEAVEEIARTVSPHLWDGRLLGALGLSKHFTSDQAAQSVARKQGEAIEDTQRFLAAAYPAIEKQIRAQISAATCAHEPHDLRISAGDEEIWVSCTCGWHVPGFWPASASADLDAAWEAWYWPHAIKEEIKAETAARIAEGNPDEPETRTRPDHQ